MSRIALVLGNSHYAGDKEVSGIEDAKAIASCLQDGLGFEVLGPVLDGNLAAANTALTNFSNRIKDPQVEVAVFFYSGHGFQSGGQNFLFPPGGPVSTAGSLLLDDVLQVFGAAPNARKFAFLDACRNDTFLPAGSPVGLTNAPAAPTGVFQAFAASPGQLAASGSAGTLSPYSAALVKYLPQAGLELVKLFDLVRSEVFSVSPVQQQPIEDGAAPQNFFFRAPIPVHAVIPGGHSDILVFLRGEVVLDTDQPMTQDLLLNAGDNELALFVSNGRTHRNNHDWDITEGWSYHVDLGLPDGSTTTFDGAEDIPFKDGPHFGKVFQVAQVNLHVDEKTAELTLVGLDNDIANKGAQFFAQDQEILYQVSITDLNLTPDDILGGAVDLGSAAAILQPFLVELLKSGTILGATIADPTKTFVTVLGNKAFKDLATGCMAMRDERIRDLKASIAAAFNRNPTPFDLFDQGLIACMRSAPIPAGSPFTSDDIRVWTALTDESQNPPVAVPPAANVEEAMPAMAHQG
jgi:hypothetical protein